MIAVQRLIEVFRQIIGWPYASPGVNGPGGIDCSGALVYAYRQFGMRIYHGSNRIARVECRDMRPVSSIRDLAPGMAIFKARANTDGMKAEYKPGGRYYNPALPEDFYHMGLVASVAPLQIINATSPVARVDNALKNWNYAGYLNAVNYDETPEKPDPDAWAVVAAESGGSVNLRKEPKDGATVLTRVPLGREVRLLSGGDAVWQRVRYQQTEGYMMKKFLRNICTPSDTG